ncbi:MAG: cytochrome c family protein [Pseudomonadota bacterium]
MMDSFEINKIAGAILFSLLVVLGLRALGETVFHVAAPETPGYAVEVAEEGTSAAPQEVVEATPLSQLLAAASVEKGQKGFRKCSACHKVDQGASGGVGPNLYGIVGAAKAAVEGFAYSKALRDANEAIGPWTYESLNKFLTKPKDYIPGTKMAFAGLKKETDRADMLAYLKSISPDAPDFPTE